MFGNMNNAPCFPRAFARKREGGWQLGTRKTVRSTRLWSATSTIYSQTYTRRSVDRNISLVTPSVVIPPRSLDLVTPTTVAVKQVRHHVWHAHVWLLTILIGFAECL